VIHSAQGETLVAWTSQDTNAIHAAAIDLKTLKQKPMISVSAPNVVGQRPVIGGMNGVTWIAWSETSGGPMAPRIARVLAGPSLDDIYSLEVGGVGPAFPAGFVPGDKVPNVVILRSGPKAGLAFSRPQHGDAVPIVELQAMLFPEFASAT